MSIYIPWLGYGRAATSVRRSTCSDALAEPHVPIAHGETHVRNAGADSSEDNLSEHNQLPHLFSKLKKKNS